MPGRRVGSKRCRQHTAAMAPQPFAWTTEITWKRNDRARLQLLKNHINWTFPYFRPINVQHVGSESNSIIFYLYVHYIRRPCLAMLRQGGAWDHRRCGAFVWWLIRDACNPSRQPLLWSEPIAYSYIGPPPCLFIAIRNWRMAPLDMWAAAAIFGASL